MKHSNPSRRSIHTRKFDRCVRDVKAKGGGYDPFAVCTSSLGYRGSIKAGHRRKNPVTSGYLPDSVYGPDNVYWSKTVSYFVGVPEIKSKPYLFFTSGGWKKTYVLDPKYNNNLIWYPGDKPSGHQSHIANSYLPRGYHLEVSSTSLRSLSQPRKVEHLRIGKRKHNPTREGAGFVLVARNGARRAYYDGEMFTTSKTAAKVYASIAHVQLAARMMQRDHHLKRGWRFAAAPAARRNPIEPGEKLYTDFHGEPPQHVKHRKIPVFREGVEVGPMVAITYDTIRDGDITRYEHEFKQSASPLVVVSDDGRKMAVIGGDFRFTDRGFIDHPKH